MAGSISKRAKGKYLVRVSLGFDPVTGKRAMHNRVINGTRKEAQDHLTEVLERKRQGLARASHRTLGEVLIQWLDTVKRHDVAANTFTSYVDLTQRYIPEPLLNRRIDSISMSDLQSLYSSLQRTPGAKGVSVAGHTRRKALGARTIRLLNAILSGVFAWAAQDGLVGRNPTLGVKLPRKTRPRTESALTAAQITAFVTEGEHDRYGLLFLVGLMTGLRPGELRGLRWVDVDFRNARIRVMQSIGTRRGGGYRVTDLKTEDSRRWIPIGAKLSRHLRVHKKEQARQRLAVGSDWEDHGLVWTTMRGTPVNERHVITRHFKPILERAGLPNETRWYDLRHTMATQLLEAGENPKIVAERLGHRHVSTTLHNYAHVLPGMQERATEKMEVLLRVP